MGGNGLREGFPQTARILFVRLLLLFCCSAAVVVGCFQVGLFVLL